MILIETAGTQKDVCYTMVNVRNGVSTTLMLYENKKWRVYQIYAS